jgi:hypothetical protein
VLKVFVFDLDIIIDYLFVLLWKLISDLMINPELMFDYMSFH